MAGPVELAGRDRLARLLAELVLPELRGLLLVAAELLALRLRPLGLRLDPTVVRERPRHGWESLTRTEVTVADDAAVASAIARAATSSRWTTSLRRSVPSTPAMGSEATSSGMTGEAQAACRGLVSMVSLRPISSRAWA